LVSLAKEKIVALPEALRVVSSHRCLKPYQIWAVSGSLDVMDGLAVSAQFEKD